MQGRTTEEQLDIANIAKEAIVALYNNEVHEHEHNSVTHPMQHAWLKQKVTTRRLLSRANLPYHPRPKKHLAKRRGRQFWWTRELDEKIDDILKHGPMSPYSVLVELRKSGMPGVAVLTTRLLKGLVHQKIVVKRERDAQLKNMQQQDHENTPDSEIVQVRDGVVDTKQLPQNDIEQLCEMLPPVCREWPTVEAVEPLADFVSAASFSKSPSISF